MGSSTRTYVGDNTYEPAARGVRVIRSTIGCRGPLCCCGRASRAASSEHKIWRQSAWRSPLLRKGLLQSFCHVL